MRFGWQGFELIHPEEWSPVALTGTRAEGYVRIASGERLGIQLRWKQHRSEPNLHQALDPYLDRLRKDAKKASENFDSDVNEEGRALTYRWKGAGQARGSLFYSAESRRIFFLEVVGGRKDSLQPHFRALRESFSDPDSNRELWALFGLEAHLPRDLTVEKPLLQSGRTKLTLFTRGVRVSAERWAFGAELLSRHSPEDWCRNALGMLKAEFTEEEEGWRLSRKALARPRTEAIVQYQPERNQIVAIKSIARHEKWRPKWDWLT